MMSHGSSAPPLRLSPGLGDLLPVQDAGRSVVEHGQESQAELLILALAVPVAVPPSLLCLFLEDQTQWEMNHLQVVYAYIYIYV